MIENLYKSNFFFNIPEVNFLTLEMQIIKVPRHSGNVSDTCEFIYTSSIYNSSSSSSDTCENFTNIYKFVKKITSYLSQNFLTKKPKSSIETEFNTRPGSFTSPTL